MLCNDPKPRDHFELVYTQSVLLVFQAIWLVRYLAVNWALFTPYGVNNAWSKQNKMAGVNSRFATISDRRGNIENPRRPQKVLLRSLSEYILKQSFFSYSANSGRIFTEISKNNCNYYAFLHRKLYRKHRNLLKDIACDCGLPIYIFFKLIHLELLKKKISPFQFYTCEYFIVCINIYRGSITHELLWP